MSDIIIGIEQLEEPSKSIGKILIDFYETMKRLENDKEVEGKQAVLIVMTMNDIENLCFGTKL